MAEAGCPRAVSIELLSCHLPFGAMSRLQVPLQVRKETPAPLALLPRLQAMLWRGARPPRSPSPLCFQGFSHPLPRALAQDIPIPLGPFLPVKEIWKFQLITSFVFLRHPYPETVPRAPGAGDGEGPVGTSSSSAVTHRHGIPAEVLV